MCPPCSVALTAAAPHQDVPGLGAEPGWEQPQAAAGLMDSRKGFCTSFSGPRKRPASALLVAVGLMAPGQAVSWVMGREGNE